MHKDYLDYYYHFDQRGTAEKLYCRRRYGAGSGKNRVSYGSDNNMIGAEANGTNWAFRYNANNQKYYSKIAFGAIVIDKRFYIYDGLDCIAETDTDGTILREYIRIGNVGGIVVEIRHNDTTCAPGYESGTYYYHYNHRGALIAVNSYNVGGIIFKADYDAYDKITRIDTGRFEPRYTFSTKRYFKDLELYYYGYRWYLPELRRWTTKDPIGFAGKNLNCFAFCNNNSITQNDKYGLKCPENSKPFATLFLSQEHRAMQTFEENFKIQIINNK